MQMKHFTNTSREARRLGTITRPGVSGFEPSGNTIGRANDLCIGVK